MIPQLISQLNSKLQMFQRRFSYKSIGEATGVAPVLGLKFMWIFLGPFVHHHVISMEFIESSRNDCIQRAL
jgi:hypothetical protein